MDKINIDEILGLDSKQMANNPDYQNWKSITPKEAKQAIKEIVERVLELAAENAETICDNLIIKVDKEIITNTINQIEF